MSVDEQIEVLLNYHNRDYPLTWFDVEFAPTLGIDVYETPFPHEQGFQIIKSGRIELLILKVELSDAIKEQAIQDFLDDPTFKLHATNVASEKVYADNYKEFRQSIVLSSEYVDSLLNARYTKHFYTSEELASIREQWLTPMKNS